MVTKNNLYMGKILLAIFLFFFFAFNSFALGKDSVFVVHIENDATTSHLLNNRIYIVFENISNDTIMLFSEFKNYYGDYPGISGYSLHFYCNKKLVLPVEEEMPPQYYAYKNGRVKVAPKEIVKMKMSLPLFGNKERAEINEYGIELHLRYRYYSINDRIIKTKYFKSDYLILTYK